MSPKGPVPPSIFKIFCNKFDFQEAQRVPPFTILKTLHFLSLRYSADFSRSCLVSSYCKLFVTAKRAFSWLKELYLIRTRQL